MAQYYPAPMSFYYAVPAVPVVWYVPTRSKPNPPTPSQGTQGLRKRHSLKSPPDAHSPSKRLQGSSLGSLYAQTPWPAGVPSTPELRTVPLPGVNDVYANGEERAHYSSAPPPWGRSASTHPSVDPFLVVPHHPNTRPPIVWDLMRHPSTAFLDHPSLTHDALRRRCAVRASRVDGRQPLRSLVLIFPLLPMEMEIVPSQASLRAGLGYVSLWDVLEGLYHGLRAPIAPHELRELEKSERETLLAAAEVRRRGVPEIELSGSAGGNTLRKIDYLSRRRRFLGIRPALGYELPGGRKLGEVFVVEVGTAAG
ncbi:hypothetical protein LXA43DRAFT_1162329 [Ganoderma leucocontextum]|nr:hypothetical protein LXA43DRAFT_1162329 [Ganoderma leucocontextum]